MPIIYGYRMFLRLDSEPELEDAVVARSVQDQRGSAPEDVSVIVRELQRIADTSGPRDSPFPPIDRLRIMFVVGSTWPWRAIESDRASPHKRMMCFRESEQIRSLLLERLEWQRADEEFEAEHLATPGGFPGITSDWVPSRLFEAMFESYRLAARAQGYQTTPDRVVNLSHTCASAA
jgi:hypothetical protein